MKKEQQVILSLLKEIDQICRKHKIDYYLSPRLTLCAVKEESFPQNPLFGVVLMKVADMERFRLAVQEELDADRELESMKTHKWFPGFYLRYVNTETLCINLDAGRDYAYPGLGVNIFPLRTKISSKRDKRRNNLEENGWLQICDSFNGDGSFKDFLVKTAVRIRCLGGQARVAAAFYDNFCRRMQEPEPENYVLKRRRNVTKFPAEIFAKTKEVTLEGETFKVPFDTDAYLKANYGEDYQKMSEPSYVQAPQMIVSARVSCAKFLRNQKVWMN